jgi:hypothetical protein
MNAEQATTYLQALIGQVTVGVIIPLFLFFVMLTPLVWILWIAQRRDDFDAADFLKDETGKLSYGRLTGAGGFCVTSWGYATAIVNGHYSAELMLAFGILWAASPAIVEAAKKWDGSLPFGKGK